MSESENNIAELPSQIILPRIDGDLIKADEILEEATEKLCSICLDALPSPALQLTRSTRQTQLLATIEPCKHQYHDFCIKSWSERANTCPACRCRFSSITLTVGDEVFDKVAVQDKVLPVPEGDFFDDDMIEDDYTYDDYADPDYHPRRTQSALVPYSVCILCDRMSSSATGLVICNSCSGSFHPLCLGSISNSDVWNCPMCDSTQSCDSIIPPQITRSRAVVASDRAVNSFISSLRSEIRSNRRNALGLPLESIGRRRRNLRSNNDTVMFLPAAEAPEVSASTLKMSKEEADSWKLYDRAMKASGGSKSEGSSRAVTPVPSQSLKQTTKKVKKPVRKKHRDPETQMRASEDAAPMAQSGKMTTVGAILSSIKTPSRESHYRAGKTESNNFVEAQSPRNHSPSSLSYSSHETSPTSESLSSDDESGSKFPRDLDAEIAPTKLTLEALAQHDSRLERASSLDTSSRVISRRDSEQKTDLSLAQKQMLQKAIVRTKLKPLYNENKIDTDEYTLINKSVSRRLYKAVAENELQGEQRFIILLNKLIELRERLEHESFENFTKRISSDTYTTSQDRQKLAKYTLFADQCINEEIECLRSKGR